VPPPVQNVAATAGAATERVVDAAAATAEPVAKTVQSPVQEVAATASSGVDDLAAAGKAGSDTVAAVSEAVSGATENPVVSDVVSGADSVASAAGISAREAVSRPDVVEAVSGDAGSVVPQASEAVTGTIETVFGPGATVRPSVEAVEAGADAGVAAAARIAASGDPLTQTVQSLAQDLAASPGVAVDLLAGAGGTGVESMAAVSDAVLRSEDFLLVSGGVGVALGIAGYAARGAGFGSSAPILFTSFRLIPCYAAEVVQHYLSSAAARTANVVGRWDAGRSAAGHATEATGGDATAGDVTEANGAKPKGLLASADGLAQAFRDGFSHGANGLADGDGEAARDSRLMMQMGMLLGMVYLGFLTIWFWATRLRPQAGS
jgi:hypothetical protein